MKDKELRIEVFHLKDEVKRLKARLDDNGIERDYFDYSYNSGFEPLKFHVERNHSKRLSVTEERILHIVKHLGVEFVEVEAKDAKIVLKKKKSKKK